MLREHLFGLQAESYSNYSSLAQGVIVGSIAGLLGTLAMHLFGTVVFLILGWPWSVSFSIIGNAAAGFSSLIGIEIAGGAQLGAVLFYLMGLAMGAAFGAAESRIEAVHVDSPREGLWLGILYVEAMSLPLLVPSAVVLGMTASGAALWFGLSFVLHLVYGGVLGAVVSYGLPTATSAGNRRRSAVVV